MVTLKDQLQQDKLTLMAMNALLDEYAAKLEVSLTGTLSAQCKVAILSGLRYL